MTMLRKGLGWKRRSRWGYACRIIMHVTLLKNSLMCSDEVG